MKHVRIIASAVGMLISMSLGACGGDDVAAPAGTNPPAPGSLDTSFGNKGIVTTGTNSPANSLALQGDGKIVVAGTRNNNGGVVVVRYNSKGVPDPSFGTAGIVNTQGVSAFALAVQGDGKIVVAGTNGTNDNITLVRYNPDGQLDPSFDTDGILFTLIGITSSQANALALQPDGKIVVAGISSFGGASNIALARYNSDGALDLSFDTDGIVTTAIGSTNSRAAALALQPDGKIVVAGRSISGGASNIALVRYTAGGAPDPSFDTDGIVTTAIGSTNSQANALALQGDGKIVVAGYSVAGPTFSFALVRYTASGAPDLSFDTDGIVVTTPTGSTSSQAGAIALQEDGKIVAAGFSIVGGVLEVGLARYTPDGAFDLPFGTDGNVTTPIGTTAAAFALALQPNGKIIVAGYATIAAIQNVALARYFP